MSTKSKIAAVAGLLALGACGGGSEEPQAEGAAVQSAAYESPRSVVLFTVDTLRADRLGCYGDEDNQTPNIDSLAASGRLFLMPYTQASHTHAAMSSMLTGLYPQHTGVLGMSGLLADGVNCVAEAVRDAGFATASFASSHCSPGSVEGSVWHDGWDTIFCIREEGTEQWSWDHRVVTSAMRWMSEQEGPFLCWIHLIDPHGEHMPVPGHFSGDTFWTHEEQKDLFKGYEKRSELPTAEELELLNRLYDAEVRGSDQQVGRVLRFLKKAGLEDEVGFIFSADHGEELFETSSRWGHGRVLTEAVLQVPLIITVPGLAPEVISEPVETLQIAPTIYELLNIPLTRRLDGVSLLAKNPSRGQAISYWGDTVTIRRADLRGWLNSDSLPADPMEPLYEEFEKLSPVPWFGAKTVAARFADPGAPYAPTYLSESELEAERLRTEIWEPLQKHLATIKPVAHLDEQALEGDFLKELQSMGYVDGE